MTFSIQPLTYADFAARHRVGALTGAQDRHTQLKRLGDLHCLRDDPVSAHRDFARSLQRPTHVFAKAADADGRFLGSLGIELLGFAPEEVPRRDAAQPGAPPALPTEGEAPPVPAVDGEAVGLARRRAVEMVDRLEEMEDADRAKRRAALDPPGSRSVVVTGLAVDPAHCRRGVGGALLAWAARLADAAGVHVWVHSSEAGWRAYARAGFEVVGTLDVDLDEWAPGPPAEGGRWGHYVMRWMKRMPRAVEGEDAPKAVEG